MIPLELNLPHEIGEPFAPTTMPAGRPTLYTDEILIKTDEYISQCEDVEYKFQYMVGKTDGYEEKTKVRLPSVVGLALYLGVSNDSVSRWEQEYPEFCGKVTRVRQLQHERLMQGGLSGRYNPMIAKLLLSSAHGYREGKDVTTNGKDLPTPIVDLTKLGKPETKTESTNVAPIEGDDDL